MTTQAQQGMAREAIQVRACGSCYCQLCPAFHGAEEFGTCDECGLETCPSCRGTDREIHDDCEAKKARRG
jgi:hypothetical protein